MEEIWKDIPNCVGYEVSNIGNVRSKDRLNFDCADYCDSFTQGCAFNCGKKDREIALKWLQSEAE